jgi:hypothetical protein
MTLQEVKDCITLKGELKDYHETLCNCWYTLAVHEGKTDSAAAIITMRNLCQLLGSKTLGS